MVQIENQIIVISLSSATTRWMAVQLYCQSLTGHLLLPNKDSTLDLPEAYNLCSNYTTSAGQGRHNILHFSSSFIAPSSLNTGEYCDCGYRKHLTWGTDSGEYPSPICQEVRSWRKKVLFTLFIRPSSPPI